jgi:hypothetical protein
MSFDEIHISHVPERITGNRCPKCRKLIDGGTAVDDQRIANPRLSAEIFGTNYPPN